MIPLGYMAKYVAGRTGFLESASIDDICSVSPCISHDFCEWINLWKHNGYWMFDSPEIIREIAKSQHLDGSKLDLFYYEAFEKQYDALSRQWRNFTPESSFPTNITPPLDPPRLGFDIVSYSLGNSAECSPLSCNHLANGIPVNSHCLLESLTDARQLLEAGAFEHSEPGPYRIVAVHSLGKMDILFPG